MISERHRHMLALCGLALWVSYPFFYMAGVRAAWIGRCGQRTYAGHFDDCFNDLMPIEVLSLPLTLLFFYPFARVAFGMFAPSPEVRTRRWRLAWRRGGGAYCPLFQVIAAIGIVWSIWHLRTIPLAAANWYLLLYWLAWISWLVTGALAALPKQRAA